MRLNHLLPAIIFIVTATLMYCAYYKLSITDAYLQMMSEASTEAKNENSQINSEDISDIEKMMKIMRKDDKRFYDAMMVDISNLTQEQMIYKLFKVLTDAHQGVCRTAKKLGGEYNGRKKKAVDGDKVICLDKILRQGSCLICSFGISNDWSFEDAADLMGCKIYAHDHTVNYPPKRGADINYFKMGIGTEKNGSIDSLHNLMEANGHLKATIDYLKIDIERHEYEVLPQIIEDGTIDNVDQIGLEFHGNAVLESGRAEPALKIFQALYQKGFRLISYMPNLLAGTNERWKGYYALSEIVLMRDDVWNYLDHTE